ncbi:MAG: TlpA family protein disulfide reductase, partial [Bacteroidota bacterium]
KWDYVAAYVRNKGLTTGTREIISDIAKKFNGEAEQIELIKFYKESYDYKIVDKKLLGSLIDSLRQNGLNERIRSLATESKNEIEYRFLGKKFRDFELRDKFNRPIKLSSLNEKIVIIELWATWCGPCAKEMQKIPELRRMNPNIEFYSISVDKSAEKMKRFIDKYDYEWPIVFGGDLETNKKLWDYLNIVAIPKYYTIDRDGVVINVSDTLDEEYIKSLK